MNEITINCRRHGVVTINNLSKAGFHKGQQLYRCKLCKKIARNNNYKKNPEKVKTRVKKQKEINPEKFKSMRQKSHKKYYEKHKDKILTYHKNYDKKQTELLTDRYIKHELSRNSNLKASEIPDTLIEFKRLIMKFKRKIKIISIGKV